MAPPFQTIALIGKPDAERIAETLSRIHQHLSESGFRVLVERQCADHVPGPVTACSFEEIGANSDVAIVVGGDGTLLTTARSLIEHDIPLIGVNLGRLGFLVDISPEQAVGQIDSILGGNFQLEERPLLRTRVWRNGTVVHDQVSVNEVVIHSWNATSMIEIETSIDGVFLNSQRADGLIVSTPTGSTAYALSAGGPILHPDLNALVLAPINPHTLTNRPIVIRGDRLIEVAFRPSKQAGAQVVCDNVPLTDIATSDRLAICQHDRPFRLLHPVDHDFFAILRSKLNWSSGNRN
jgi:NAD+ kinase